MNTSLKISFLNKQINKQNAINILESNNDINSLIFEDMLDTTIIDYAASSNIYLTPEENNIEIIEGMTIGTVITKPIYPSSNICTISNIACKVYGVLPVASNIKSYIIDPNGNKYPITLNISDTFNYIDLSNLSYFKFMLELTKNPDKVSPNISSFAVFFKDSSIDY